MEDDVDNAGVDAGEMSCPRARESASCTAER